MVARRRTSNICTSVVAVLGVVHALLLLPWMRTSDGYDPMVDGWLNNIVDAGVVLVLILRSSFKPPERQGRLLLAAGSAAALGGSIAYYAHDQYLEVAPRRRAHGVGPHCGTGMVAAVCGVRLADDHRLVVRRRCQ